jgi:c-di-GMP-binding flagellar brake protein YcgR
MFKPSVPSPGADGTALDAFRERDPVAVHALLKALMDRNVPLQLGSPNGVVYTTTIWSLEAGKRLGLTGKVLDPAVHRLVESDEVSATAYLDRVKLQFDLRGLMLVHGGSQSVLQALVPYEVFRFQRRSGYRVHTLERSVPTALMRHPSIPDMELALRVLDVSIGGCALFVPEDLPPLWPGSEVAGVRIELDMQTGFPATLALRHVTCIQPDVHGARLGCEWVRLESGAENVLQRYIDQTQKRRRLLALE